ncbi:uncharacterized protein [Drosophila tropicalis]|uniref:uncharacterized protein isoform X1 n=1 Tax=Drosophila tropicalis TaxID=46794 RepID=UPI0035AB6E4E
MSSDKMNSKPDEISISLNATPNPMFSSVDGGGVETVSETNSDNIPQDEKNENEMSIEHQQDEPEIPSSVDGGGVETVSETNSDNVPQDEDNENEISIEHLQYVPEMSSTQRAIFLDALNAVLEKAKKIVRNLEIQRENVENQLTELRQSRLS